MLHDLVTTINSSFFLGLFVKDTKMFIIHTLNIYLRIFLVKKSTNSNFQESKFHLIAFAEGLLLSIKDCEWD